MDTKNNFLKSVFEPAFYLKKNEKAVQRLGNFDWDTVIQDFKAYSKAEFSSPSSLFSAKCYLDNSRKSLSAVKGDVISDYLATAKTSEFSPNPLFDHAYYKRAIGGRKDIFDAIENDLFVSLYHHYLNTNLQGGYNSHPLFQSQYFSILGREKMDFKQFCSLSLEDEFMLTPLFDPEFYKNYYDDVKDQVASSSHLSNSLFHFLEIGILENRIPCPDFDLEYYMRSVPGLEDAIANGNMKSATYHWFYHGAEEGKNPNRFFNSHYYLDRNPQVLKQMKSQRIRSAFEHFILLGQKQGLKCNPPIHTITVNEDISKASFSQRCRIVAERAKVRPVRNVQPSADKQFSIVIPVFNHFEFTANLLTQLFSCVETVNAEIIVVDDCSTDETVNLLKYFPDIVYIRSKEQGGFPKSCNLGAKAAKTDTLFILNNDIEVLSGSFTEALKFLDENENAAAVGGQIIRTNNRLQEAGSAVFNNGHTLGIGRDRDPLDKAFGSVKEVEFCSAAFIAFRKSSFDFVGGFDEKFSPGYYEEVDLCARMVDQGWKIYYSPDIAIYHYEYASFSKGRPPITSVALMKKHRELFKNKNANFIKRLASPFSFYIRNMFSGNVPRVILVEDKIPFEKLGSGFTRANLIVRSLLGLGVEVCLYTVDANDSADWSETRKEFRGLRILSMRDCSLSDLLSSVEFDILWVCRTHNGNRFYEHIEANLSKLKRTKIVFDTEAFAANRKKCLMDIASLNYSNDSLLLDIKNEIKLSSLADVTLVVNQLEKEQFSKIYPDKSVEVLGHAFERMLIDRVNFKGRKGFVFLGAIHNMGSPNFDSLRWYLEEVWPLIVEKDKTSTLSVAGFQGEGVAIPENWKKMQGVRFLGAVEDLTSLFNSHRVFVAPTRIAAGIPHKVHEALRHGIPCVVSTVLMKQLGLKEGEGCVSTSTLQPSEFAKTCIELNQMEKKWLGVASHIDKICETDLSISGFENTIKQLVLDNKAD